MSAAPDEPLPPLQSAILDRATLERFFDDVAACATDLSVLVKGRVDGRASSGVHGLDAARELLESRAVAGLQLRYRWKGEPWCDTLLWTAEGVRLVRIGAAERAIGRG